MFGYIYEATYFSHKLKHDVYYVGQRKLPKGKDFWTDNYTGSGRIIQRHKDKYGVEDITISLLLECFSYDDMNANEKHFIKLCKQNNGEFCLNKAEGGEGGNTRMYFNNEEMDNYCSILKQAQQELISDTERKQRKIQHYKEAVGRRTEEEKEKIKQAHRQRYKNLSDEEKEKISQKVKDGLKKWRESLTEDEYNDYLKRISPKGKKKPDGFGDSRRGDKNHMWNKKHTSETRRKMSENHSNVSGKNNPMYGKKYFWVNNGQIRKKVFEGQEIPEGFVKGFQIKENSIWE